MLIDLGCVELPPGHFLAPAVLASRGCGTGLPKQQQTSQPRSGVWSLGCLFTIDDIRKPHQRTFSWEKKHWDSNNGDPGVTAMLFGESIWRKLYGYN